MHPASHRRPQYLVVDDDHKPFALDPGPVVALDPWRFGDPPSHDIACPVSAETTTYLFLKCRQKTVSLGFDFARHQHKQVKNVSNTSPPRNQHPASTTKQYVQLPCHHAPLGRANQHTIINCSRGSHLGRRKRRETPPRIRWHPGAPATFLK